MIVLCIGRDQIVVFWVPAGGRGQRHRSGIGLRDLVVSNVCPQGLAFCYSLEVVIVDHPGEPRWCQCAQPWWDVGAGFSGGSVSSWRIKVGLFSFRDAFRHRGLHQAVVGMTAGR